MQIINYAEGIRVVRELSEISDQHTRKFAKITTHTFPDEDTVIMDHPYTDILDRKISRAVIQ